MPYEVIEGNHDYHSPFGKEAAKQPLADYTPKN